MVKIEHARLTSTKRSLRKTGRADFLVDGSVEGQPFKGKLSVETGRILFPFPATFEAPEAAGLAEAHPGWVDALVEDLTNTDAWAIDAANLCEAAGLEL